MNIEKAIEIFLKYYPNTEDGLCHIVFGDYNLSNVHIYWCMNLLDDALSNPGFGYNQNECQAARMFLELLLLIPENERG